MYLTYDIRSIQKFIFSAPNLQCIIGASSQIAAFDRAVADQFHSQVVFTGGGSGALQCDEEHLEQIAVQLIERARAIGADVRIGRGRTLEEAKTGDRLFAYEPTSMAGEPCAMSGIYPVDPDDASTQWNVDPRVHALMGARREASRADALNADLLDELTAQVRAMGGTMPDAEPCFFRNVNLRGTEKHVPADGGWDKAALGDAAAGSASLGRRNRWAVIAMDGNDAGQQHLRAQKLVDKGVWSEHDRDAWIRVMSRELRDATRRAFVHAAAAATCEWLAASPDLESCMVRDDASAPVRLILPLRPLILGGDDVILLCHTRHALTFVKAMAEQFETLAVQAAKNYRIQTQQRLWPASNDRLTISAGVLYCKKSYPLHAAVDYAHSLLGSAKGRFRGSQAPMPAAIDFDVATDSLLDSPAERRQRELQFVDDELDEEVRLTERPYRLSNSRSDAGDDVMSLADLESEIDEVLTSADGPLPRSLQATLLGTMTQPWSARVQLLLSLSRKYPRLYERYVEERVVAPGKGWRRRSCDAGSRQIRSTSLIDALLILEEKRRQERETDVIDLAGRVRS
ncbi:MAG: hypothetical protein KDA61_12310 [Planctomycetales bacterium]|nr:hypothetical protein [Planctomycetales bacterium]